ncbi:SDR family oxidoreductase [Chitinophaga caeni]|nr:SDR family oxidoreductase [Chitinophaga caeni]
MMEKVLITGSNGLLGKYLVQLYSQQKEIRCIACSRGANRLKQTEGYVYEPVDFTSEEAFQTLVRKHRPQVIIHAGAMTQADDCERNKEACWNTNVTATEQIVKIANEVGAFLVFLSTDFVFDGLSGPYREEDLVNPVNYYGASKVAAERVVMQTAKNWAIVRTVLVYGLADDPKRGNIITWVRDNLRSGKNIKVVTDQWRTPTYAGDLAEACRLIAGKRAGGIFHISGEEMLTPFEMAQQVAKYYSLDAGLMIPVDADSFTQPAMRPAKTGFIIEKAKAVLGYQPISFNEGIRLLEQL